MGDWQEVIEQIQASGADIDPVMIDQVSSFMESSGRCDDLSSSGSSLALLFGVILRYLGGLIGGSIFKVEPCARDVHPDPPPPPVG